tara:strand:- start:183 stop:455 length:273 start_codon:yes stop_codon:yes gene_type:complete
MKDEEHIIDYILKIQDYWRYRTFKRKKRKWKSENVDKYVFICDICSFLWERVEKFISKDRWVKYTDQTIPTIGKKKKTCPDCKKPTGVCS